MNTRSKDKIGQSNFQASLKRAIGSPGGHAFLASMLALGIMIFAWWSASQWYRTQLMNDLRRQVEGEVALRGNTLSAVMNRRLALLEGLAAFVRTGQDRSGFEARFKAYAADLYDSAPGIRSFSIAPGGVVRSIFPLEGNEAALGYEPLSDPRAEVHQDVLLAMESREIVLTGPIELVQGGRGFIARKAMYIGDQYWGLANIILDAEPIFERAGFDDRSGLIVALYNQKGQFLHGSAEILNQNPVFQRIELPGAMWWLAGIPEQGWEQTIRRDLTLFQGGGFVIVLLVTGLIFLSVNRQARLAKAVELRTRMVSRVNERLKKDIAERRRAEEALKEREAQYRSIFETVRDGLFINDLDGRLVGFNPAAHEMHGYSREEFAQLEPLEFIHPGSHHKFEEYLQAIRAGRQFRSPAMDVKKDGTLIHVEVFGTPYSYQGKPHTLAVVRDVTEQIQAFQMLENRVEDRTRALSTLLEISQKITSTLELKPLLDQILDQIQKIVEYTCASVLTLEGQTLITQAYRGPLPKESELRMRYNLNEAAHFKAVVKRQAPVIIEDKQADDPLANAFRNATQDRDTTQSDLIRCWLGVPLLLKDKVIGMLTFDHDRPGHYKTEHASLATAFASQAVVAIENARLYEQASALASLQERQRLARELHDSVSQALYGIGLGVRTIQTQLESTDDSRLKADLAEPLDYVISLAEAGLAEMRALIFELRPDSLEEEGLVSALKKQANALRSRHQLQVETCLGEEPDLPIELKQALYRIAQEAMHNTVKHAHAKRVTISLAADNGLISLEVGDDGHGFDPEGEFPGHLGLRSMQERASKVGGSLTIESTPDQGTQITVQVPTQT